MPEEAILTEEERQVDVCILGTGLTESLVAAALARHGRRVLHVDRAASYGGNWRALNLAELEAWAASQGEPEATGTALADADGASPSAEGAAEQPPAADRDLEGLTAVDLEVGCPASCFQLRHLAWDPEAARTDEEREALRADLLRRSGTFSVDLVPRLLFGRSELVDVLVESGVARYLEFQGLRSARVLTSGGLVSVPLTKSDIFQDPVLTLPEKRTLMRFVTSMTPFVGSLAFESPAQLGVDQARKVASPSEDAAGALQGVDREQSWAAFLQQQKLSPRLQDFITYAICLWDWSQQPPQADGSVGGAWPEQASLTTGEGLRCLGRFVSSLGLHGRGTGMPLLYPMYGAAEIAQGFTRMCALHRGVYALRTSATQLLAQQDEQEPGRWRVAGIVTQRGETVRARSVIASCDHFLQRGVDAGPGCSPFDAAGVACARITVLTNRPLLGEEGLNLCVIPPDSLAPRLANVVQVLQLDWATGTCPKEYNVIQLSQAAAGIAEDAQAEAVFADLERALTLLLEQTAGDAGRSCCLFKLRYLQRPRRLDARWRTGTRDGDILAACTADRGLVLCADPAATPQLLVGREVAEAREAFLGAPVFGEAVPTAEDFLRKPQHVAQEEQASTVMEDLANFNEQMQSTSAAGGVAAAAEALGAHGVDADAAVADAAGGAHGGDAAKDVGADATDATPAASAGSDDAVPPLAFAAEGGNAAKDVGADATDAAPAASAASDDAVPPSALAAEVGAHAAASGPEPAAGGALPPEVAAAAAPAPSAGPDAA